jgi:hypothetical protein
MMFTRLIRLAACASLLSIGSVAAQTAIHHHVYYHHGHHHHVVYYHHGHHHHVVHHHPLVADPEKIYEKGLGWKEMYGEGKGVLQLNPRGSAVVYWNGITYWGRWEKVDTYHVKTTWPTGGPPGSVWAIYETGNPAVPYIGTRGQP